MNSVGVALIGLLSLSVVYSQEIAISLPKISGYNTFAEPTCPNSSEEIIYYPNLSDCSKYYECYEGVRYTYNCPTGLYWNVNVNQCDYPENVEDCRDGTRATDKPSTAIASSTEAPTLKTTPPAQTTSRSPRDEKCPFPSDETTFLPYPGDCTKFYECFDGYSTAMSCPNGLYWNQKISECDFQDNVDCKQ